MAPRSPSYQASATPAIIFAQLIVIAVTTLVLVWLLHFRGGLALNSDNREKIFNLHPFLMVVGFLLITGEAIMAYKMVPATRNTQKAVHLILHFIALLAGILGIYAVFKFKHQSGFQSQDMVTLHSWLGIITISLFGLQLLLAFFSFVFPRAEMPTRASYTPWHTFGGLLIFFLAICTVETGLVQIFLFLGLGHNREGLIVNFTGLLIFLFAVTVGLTVVLPRGY